MRILNIHMKNTLTGGAEIVFAKGGRLLAAQGHQLAWLTIGQLPDFMRRDEPAYFIPEIADGRGRGALAMLARHFYNPQSYHLAERAIHEFQPDIVHLHTVFGYRHLSPSVLLPFKKLGIPLVQTLHDFGLLCPATYLLSGGRVCEACRGGRYRFAATQRCLDGNRARSLIAALNAYIKDHLYHYDSLITAYIAPSRFLRQKYIEFGYQPDKISVIPNAFFSPENLSPHPAEKRRDYLLFVGRLSYEKGVDILLRAAQTLNFPIKIAGDGAEMDKLQKLARDLQLDHVEFLGFQPHETISNLYRNAAFLVMPSRWYENGPLVILEAFSQGTPVIAARMGALPEFVREGQTGYLFNANDSNDLRRVLTSALEQLDTLQAMEQNCLRYIRTEHDPELYVTRLEGLLQQMAAGKMVDLGLKG